MKLRWDHCIVQTDDKLSRFLKDFIDQPGRRCFVVGGAGFDPRAVSLASRLSKLQHTNVTGVFLREERPNPQPMLRDHADKHQKEIQGFLPSVQVREINIFSDRTVIGGRQAVGVMPPANAFDGITDIIVDISALSTGVFFTLIRHFLEICDQRTEQGRVLNLHIVVAEEAKFDHKILGMPWDSATLPHGYRGAESLEANPSRALLWIPTLAPGNVNVSVLDCIYRSLSRPLTPIDVCPIIPFPGHDPRLPDKLVEQYRESLNQWKTDMRNFLYAAESDPIDSYRTICAVCESRERTFKDLDGSTVVLSPIGNKLLAAGAMLAAIERNLPVALVEVVGYDEHVKELAMDSCENTQMTHLWLAGEAYAGKSSTL